MADPLPGLGVSGELFARIRAETRFEEEHARVLFGQIASTVAYLHTCGVVHRDLKPENMLFVSEAHDAILKIVDFGFASEFAADKPLSTPLCTIMYHPTSDE